MPGTRRAQPDRLYLKPTKVSKSSPKKKAIMKPDHKTPNRRRNTSETITKNTSSTQSTNLAKKKSETPRRPRRERSPSPHPPQKNARRNSRRRKRMKLQQTQAQYEENKKKIDIKRRLYTKKKPPNSQNGYTKESTYIVNRNSLGL